MSKFLQRTMWGTAIFLFGVMVGIARDRFRPSLHERGFSPRLVTFPPKRLGSDGLINPLLECGLSEPLLGQNPEVLQSLRLALSQVLSEHHVKKASLFFQDLTSGNWLGVAENETYRPASLLKVSFLLKYLRASEKIPGLLERKIEYTHELEAGLQREWRQAEASLVPGVSYSVRELLEKTIIESSNAAFATLTSEPWARKILEDIPDLQLPRLPGPDLELAPLSYIMVFRVLYNATYLSEINSNYALQLLSRTTFRSGIVAGVPAYVTVAHKYGYHSSGPTDSDLHDCGIVYFPKRPYLLCIMTRGSDLPTQVQLVQGLSRAAYHAMQSRPLSE